MDAETKAAFEQLTRNFDALARRTADLEREVFDMRAAIRSLTPPDRLVPRYPALPRPQSMDESMRVYSAPEALDPS